jgi:hypothetical protein
MQARLLVGCILLCCHGACRAEPAGWEGSVTDSAGIAIVTNRGHGVWGTQDGWTVKEEIRIGTAEGDPEYQFGQVGAIAALSDGRVAVLDIQAQRIELFGPDGKYESTIGGPGGGPGEMGIGAGPVLVARGDTLVVPDVQNRRVNLYAPDGSPFGSYAVRIADGLPLRWEVTGAGTIVSQVRPLGLSDTTSRSSSDLLVVRGADGSVTDTLLAFPSGKSFSFREQRAQIFASEPTWALLQPDGLVFGINSEYRLSLYDGDGTLRVILSRPFEARPITAGDQKTMMDAFEKLWRQFGLSQAQIAQARSVITFADNYPAYLQILGGPEETVWAQHVQLPSALTDDQREVYNPGLDLGAPEWDVFDRDGRYLGIVRMPTRFMPLRFIGDKIYGIQRDELDVQYVVRLGIVKGATAGA